MPSQLNPQRHWLWLCLLLGIGILIWGVGIEPDRVTIREVNISHAALAGAIGGKKIVQLTDLHIKTIGRREQKVLRLLEKLKPDLLLLTGDYVHFNGDYEAALEFLSRLRASSGVYAVMGDYDYSRSRQSCRFCHEPGTGQMTKRHQVRFFRDSGTVIQMDGKPLVLAGVDSDQESSLAILAEKLSRQGKVSPHLLGQQNVPSQKGSNSGQGGEGGPSTATIPALVLCHNPMKFAELPPGLDWVILAGDTHGGQLPLPGFLWKILGYRKNQLYNYGLFAQGQNQMFVSRGLGTSHLRFRFLEPPEIVVYHFVK